MTRGEHIRWCKQRALELLDADEPVDQALTSMMSDLRKHDETRGLAESVAPLFIWTLMQRSRTEARKFIEGFTE
jgi:hypothetical protein